jgi:hypothetical protein
LHLPGSPRRLFSSLRSPIRITERSARLSTTVNSTYGLSIGPNSTGSLKTNICQIGSLISAGVAFGVRNYSTSWAWRIPSLLQIAIPVLAAYGILFAPESPRWLISKNRNDEARAMLTKYHAGGDGTSPIVIFEMSEIEKTLALEREAKESASYMDMFKTKGNRHRLFITVTLGVFGQWVGKYVLPFLTVLQCHCVVRQSQRDLIAPHLILQVFLCQLLSNARFSSTVCFLRR